MSILYICKTGIWKSYKVQGRAAVCMKCISIFLPLHTLWVKHFSHKWNHSTAQASFHWQPISLHELFKSLSVKEEKSPSDCSSCSTDTEIFALETPALVSHGCRLATAWKLRQMIKRYSPEQFSFNRLLCWLQVTVAVTMWGSRTAEGLFYSGFTWFLLSLGQRSHVSGSSMHCLPLADGFSLKHRYFISSKQGFTNQALIV